MSQYLISVCVRTGPRADRDQIVRLVVGHEGRLRPKMEPTRFWARTPLTLKQVQSIEGVKDCQLSPVSW